jgi:hypothetical protein
MSDKNEQPSSRARRTSTSARSQRLLQRGGAPARTLTVIAVTAILALGGLGTRSVAASGRSLALESGRSGFLTGVSADSATDAWAVGGYFDPTTGSIETLALHWNGTKWSKVASPNPGGTSSGASLLNGVSADSATDAWAVGYYVNPTTRALETLALHWNGTKWSTVSSPNPGGTSMNVDNSILNGVSADSATDAWAVGYYNNPTTGAFETLALHWNGTKWSKVASPNPGGQTSMNVVNNILDGVSGDSATDAWAVGYYVNPTTGATETLALHWNGTKWSKVASPNPGGMTSTSDNSELTSVSANSATDAWAVGDYVVNPTTGASDTLALHWNGTKWIKVASPNPGGTNSDASSLTSVSASATDAWAVGSYFNPTTFAIDTLALHWNGTKWSTVSSPNPGGTGAFGTSFLSGVSANSATDAWAVGYYPNPTTGAEDTLALHWNGTSWSTA